MNLDDMIRLAEEQARRVLLNTREELAPMWLMLDAKGEVQIAATPWHGDAQKHFAVEAMRSIMRKRQVIAYSLLIEAWIAKVPSDSPDMKGTEYVGLPPSERPDRQEAVVVTVANHWGQAKHRSLLIVRDKKGRCVELRRLDGPHDNMWSSRFDNLLQTQGRPN